MQVRRQRGSVAVEYALSIPLLVLLLLVLIQFFFVCVERQLMNYTAFMAGRSRMVRADNAYRDLAKEIVPWASATVAPGSAPDAPSVHVQGHKPIFNLSNSPLGSGYQLHATVPVYPHPQVNHQDEDNPICGGGVQC